MFLDFYFFWRFLKKTEIQHSRSKIATITKPWRNAYIKGNAFVKHSFHLRSFVVIPCENPIRILQDFVGSCKIVLEPVGLHRILSSILMFDRIILRTLENLHKDPWSLQDPQGSLQGRSLGIKRHGPWGSLLRPAWRSLQGAWGTLQSCQGSLRDWARIIGGDPQGPPSRSLCICSTSPNTGSGKKKRLAE